VDDRLGGYDGVAAVGSGGIYDNAALLPPASAFYTSRVPGGRHPRRRRAHRRAGPGRPLDAQLPGEQRRLRIPSTAVAVAVNLVAVQATAGGHLTLFAGDALAPPLASSINFAPGQTRANNAWCPWPRTGPARSR